MDDECRTNLPNVWAIGDVVRSPLIGTKASETVAVAEHIAGQKPPLGNVPFIVPTRNHWVGKTEEQLQAAGIATKGTAGRRKRTRRLGQNKG